MKNKYTFPASTLVVTVILWVGLFVLFMTNGVFYIKGVAYDVFRIGSSIAAVLSLATLFSFVFVASKKKVRNIVMLVLIIIGLSIGLYIHERQWNHEQLQQCLNLYSTPNEKVFKDSCYQYYK